MKRIQVAAGRVTIIGVVAATTWQVAVAGAQITALDPLPGHVVGLAHGVSADGSTVVGNSNPASGPRHAVRWPASGGTQDLGLLEGAETWARGVNADGTAVVGGSDLSGVIQHAFRWTAALGMQNLGRPSIDAYAVSGDGSTVVGFGYNGTAFHGFVWRGTMQELGLPSGFDTSQARGISFDGSAIVGQVGKTNLAADQAVFWTANGGAQLVAPAMSWAVAVSSDGLVIIGLLGGERSFRWTSAGGAENLGVPIGSTIVQVYAVSGHGAAVVGTARFGDDSRAVLWTRSLGIVKLADYLNSQGIDLTGWTLTVAEGVSADGSVIAGNAVFNGSGHAWKVTIPCLDLPLITFQPSNLQICPTSTAIFHVAALDGAASSPVTYTWRKDGISLSDGPGGGGGGGTGTITGAGTSTLSVAPPLGGALDASDAGQYDCLVSNACGITASRLAMLRVCPGDFNCDGFLDPLDYNQFINAFESGSMSADFNGDGWVDPLDYNGFINAFEAGC